MKITDPCKRCIVRAGCSVPRIICPERKDYLKFRSNIKDISDRVFLAIMTISFSVMVGYTIFKLGSLAF